MLRSQSKPRVGHGAHQTGFGAITEQRAPGQVCLASGSNNLPRGLRVITNNVVKGHGLCNDGRRLEIVADPLALLGGAR